MSVKGYPAEQKLTSTNQEFATVQPSADKRNALDVIPRFVFRVGSDTVPRTAGATTGNIQAGGPKGTFIDDPTGDVKKGDVVRFINGLAAGFEMSVAEIVVGGYFLAVKLDVSELPASGDDFYALRYITQRTDDTGAQVVVAEQGPTRFIYDGVDTEVSEDTVVPANSRPLPVKILDESGNPTDLTALIGPVTETAPATDTASSGLNGRLQRVAQRLTSLIALFPTSLGQKADAASLAVTLSTEGTAQLGSLTETAPATDTASSGLNGRMQRIAQRLTSLIALLPASLGQKADAASLAVTLSTEGTAQLGSLTETAPATDTASSGLNGRMQRMAQRLTSIIALLPSSIGRKVMADSLSVTIASDQPNLPVSLAAASVDFGAATTALRTASLVGNTTGAADFNAGAVGAQTLRVVPATGSLVGEAGKVVVTTVRNDYSSGNVTTGAWTQLVASLATGVTAMEIFDSSGQTLEIGTGAAAAETRLFLVFPGGNGRVPITIASGTRISIRAVSALADVGEIDINFYN